MNSPFFIIYTISTKSILVLFLCSILLAYREVDCAPKKCGRNFTWCIDFLFMLIVVAATLDRYTICYYHLTYLLLFCVDCYAVYDCFDDNAC